MLQIFGSHKMQPEKCFLHPPSRRGGSASHSGPPASLLSTGSGHSHDGHQANINRVQEKPLNSVDDLIAQYDNIFTHGNRNAASHLWSQYVLSRSQTLTHDKIQ